MSETDSVDNPQRRNFLGAVTTVVGVGGAAAASWPFIHSMNPSSDVLANGTTEVDLSHIPPGGTHTVSWQGKPVFIVHRTPEEISKVQATLSLKDPEPDEKRVQNSQWLVVVGICTHLGCVVQWNPHHKTIECPCHAAVFSPEGKILAGPPPKPLTEYPVSVIQNEIRIKTG